MKNRKQIAMLVCITMLLTFIFPTAVLADITEVEMEVEVPGAVTLGQNVTATITIPDCTEAAFYVFGILAVDEPPSGAWFEDEELAFQESSSGIFLVNIPTSQATTTGIYRLEIEARNAENNTIAEYNGTINITEAVVVYSGGSYTPTTVKQLDEPIYKTVDGETVDTLPFVDEIVLHGEYRTGTKLVVMENEYTPFCLGDDIYEAYNTEISEIEAMENIMDDELTLDGITYTIGDTVERDGIDYLVYSIGGNFVDLLDLENSIILRIRNNAISSTFTVDDSAYGQLITINGVTYQMGYRYGDNHGQDVLLTLEGEIGGYRTYYSELGYRGFFREGFAPSDLKAADITQPVVGPEEPIDDAQPIVAYTDKQVIEIQPIYAVSVSTERNGKEVTPRDDGLADIGIRFTATDEAIRNELGRIVSVTNRITGESKVVEAVDNEVYIAETSGNVDLTFATVKTTYKNTNADVGPLHWSFGPIQLMMENDIMPKTTKTTFGVNDTITVAEAAEALYTLAGSPEREGFSHNRTLADFSPYYDAVTWAEKQGIVSSDTDVTGLVSREEMSHMIWKFSGALELDTSVGENTNILSYPDAFDISEDRFEGMQYALGAGIMGGYPDHTLKAAQDITKAETAAMLDKTYALMVEQGLGFDF